MVQYRAIKNGADYVTPEGEVVPNHRLTTDPTPPKRFAYMSDTAYTEKHLDLIHGVDCLYHESTFLKDDIARIKATLHSSAEQAAMLAKKAEVKQLIIGHYSARYTDRQVFLDEARTVFENTFAAHDGATYFF
jgi:ribonuclease Z